MKDVTLVLRVSKEFLRQHAPLPIEQSSPVNRCLFGARVTGTATTTGHPVVSMSEDQRQHRGQAGQDAVWIHLRLPVAADHLRETPERLHLLEPGIGQAAAVLSLAAGLAGILRFGQRSE
jgi:hypothetical protein